LNLQDYRLGSKYPDHHTLKNVDINGVIDFNDRSALIIDGKFLVQSLKHQGLRTFGEYADTFFNKMSNSNDLFPDLRDPFVSAIAIGTGISSCLSISDMLTSLTALKAVTILCNVFLSALTIFPFSDGFERSGNKSLLLDVLLKNVDTNGVIDFNDRSALIIDGQFLVQSLKHQGLRTFGEYADMYVGVVLRKGVRFRRRKKTW
jgi:hypothetical protein